MRLRQIKDAKTKLDAFTDNYVKEPLMHQGKWSEVFGNSNPIHLEIGMGKGQFILEMAKQHPDMNFIGLEKEASVVLKALRKMVQPQSNVRMLCIDASEIEAIFAQGEIEKIYLHFSDPWPRNRHIKRRLTHTTKLDGYRRILDDQGILAFKTDNRKLFEFSLLMLIQTNWKIEKLSLHLHEDEQDIVTTEYEDRFVGMGHPIYYIEVKKWNE